MNTVGTGYILHWLLIFMAFSKTRYKISPALAVSCKGQFTLFDLTNPSCNLLCGQFADQCLRRVR